MGGGWWVAVCVCVLGVAAHCLISVGFAPAAAHGSWSGLCKTWPQPIEVRGCIAASGGHVGCVPGEIPVLKVCVLREIP